MSAPDMNDSTAKTTGILTVAVTVAISLMLTGCESAPVKPTTTNTTLDYAASTASVADLLALAEGAPAAEASALYLQAAWAQFDQGDLDQAESTSLLISENLLDTTNHSRYQLLAAELALARGDTDSADRWLAALDFTEPTGPRADARTCAARGDYICAANQLIVSADGNPADNNLIWRYLGLAPGLEVAGEAQARQGEQRGWWQLKQATLQSRTLEERRNAVSFWQQAWPQHPASIELPTRLAASLENIRKPAHVGLVLPLSGPLARAGQAVRDGFVVAYLQQGNSPDVPTVSFYDSETMPLPQLYEQLLVDGVDLIVGPLRKELVAELNALTPELPVLALNYLDTSPDESSSILQLGLAIEDEAASIVHELNDRSIESVLVFHNYEDWSLRARRALTEDWQGRITVQPFTNVRTITEAVGAAMDVGQSLQRRDAMAAALGEELEFLPRARSDIEAVVALVNNVEANALVPALQFHFADQLPVFACSQVVRGARRDQLLELDGFQVSELPFYISADPLFLAMNQTFALDGNRFSSLDALGVDAYRVSQMHAALDRDNTSIMIGSTGVLSLGTDGRFRRELEWSVIDDGQVLARKSGKPPTGIGD